MSDEVLIVYASMSGNTEEVAELIEKQLVSEGFEVDTLSIDFGLPIPIIENHYNNIFIGTYTWDLGFAPDELSDFVEANDLKESNIHSFGTGETQFGEELFCVASDKVAEYYKSPSPVLKIEQSPRGEQEKIVLKWIDGVINNIIKGEVK